MIKRFASLKLDTKNCFIPSENFKNVKNIFFYFVKYMRINIDSSTDGWRVTLGWGWYEVARSGASYLYVVTAQSFSYRDSYKQVIVSGSFSHYITF